MGGVVDAVVGAVGDVVDAVGDVGGAIVDAAGDAVSAVADTVSGVVEKALNDPIGTIATVAAAATGQFELIPYINAANTVAHGGDLGDALKAGAISYAAGQVGGAVGDYVGGGAGPIAVDDFGVPLLPEDIAYNAATQTGLGAGSTAANIAKTVSGATTGAVLSGGDPMQAILGALTTQGIKAGFNDFGQIVDSAGNVLYNSAQDYLNTTADQPGDFPTTMKDLQAADTQLGGLAGTGGDQAGDYPTTAQDLSDADKQLATMYQNATADQAGDYPTNLAELQAADTQLGGMVGTGGDQAGDYPLNVNELYATDNTMDQTADQAGDYPTNAEELAAADQQLADMPGATTGSSSVNTKALTDYLAKLTSAAVLGKQAPGGKRSASQAHAEDMYGETPGHPKFMQNIGGVNAPVGAAPSLPGISQPHTTGMNTPGQLPNLSGSIGGAGSTNVSLPGVSTPGGTTLAGMGAPNLNLTGRIAKGKEIKFVNEPKFAADGGMMYADDNGEPQEHNPEFFSEGGLGSIENRYVKGEGDGTSDSVPAMLANGEFVIPADVVASLGNGSNDSGAQVLDEFLRVIRDHKRKADGRALPPDSKGALGYLLEAKKKAQ